MQITFWHWPDHTIGKRESRRLREEHNALANHAAELADKYGTLLASAQKLCRSWDAPHLSSPTEASRNLRATVEAFSK